MQTHWFYTAFHRGGGRDRNDRHLAVDRHIPWQHHGIAVA